MSKYVTLADANAYGIVPATSASTTGSSILQDDLNWAEGEFERIAGSQFDQQTETNVQPINGWVNRFGDMTLMAAERGPVTAVTALSFRVPGSSSPYNTWQAVTWDATNGIILPGGSNVSPPRPNAWRVTITPANFTLSAIPADDVLFQWTYTGGYANTPPPLKTLLLRMAWWKFKLREAPLGKIALPPMGMTEVIPSLPADLAMDCTLWQRTVG